MSNETNRFSSHAKCETCGFPYGWHVCLAPEILALDRTNPAAIEKTKKVIRPVTQEERDRSSEAVQRRWSAERIRNEKRNENIARDYEDDWVTIKELTVKYNIAKETVIRVLEDEGVAVRPRGLTRETHVLRSNIDAIKKEYVDDFKSLKDIAIKWNVGQRTVGRVLVECGVKLRPAARRPKYTFN